MALPPEIIGKGSGKTNGESSNRLLANQKALVPQGVGAFEIRFNLLKMFYIQMSVSSTGEELHDLVGQEFTAAQINSRMDMRSPGSEADR